MYGFRWMVVVVRCSQKHFLYLARIGLTIRACFHPPLRRLQEEQIRYLVLAAGVAKNRTRLKELLPVSCPLCYVFPGFNQKSSCTSSPCYLLC